MIPQVCYLVVSCLCALTQSFPLADSPDAVLIDYKTDSHSRFEEGQPGKAVRGSYSWIHGDKIHQVDYTADENGYRPRLTIKSAPSSELKTAVQTNAIQAELAPPQLVDKVPPAIQIGADSIIADVVVAADALVPKPVQAISQPEADEVKQDKVGPEDKVTVTHQVIANSPAASEPVDVQQHSQAELVNETDESQKTNEVVVADETDMKIPVVSDPIASDPIVQQGDSQVNVVGDVDEVEPMKVIVPQEMVVDVPAESDAEKDSSSQAQAASLDLPAEVTPDQVIADEDAVANLPVESIPDAQDSALGDNHQNMAVSQNDAQEMMMEIDPSMFEVQSAGNQNDDEVYTDDAVIVDAAIDPLASGVLDSIAQWDQTHSQDEASAYLNAMLLDYANQMYGHAKPPAEMVEIQQPEIREAEIEMQPAPFYYEDESEADDSALDYRRTSMDNSNDDAYSISFDKLYDSFLHHLHVAKEYRARSKVDDDLQDQEEASRDLQAAFRLLVDVAETFTQNLPIPEKEFANIEARSSDAPEDSILEELYYQQWLASQEQPIYYVVYPEADDYYR